jgi:hypothetical protein
MAEDKPALPDDEIADLIHRMVFELSAVSGQTLRGDTALQASRAALLIYLSALIQAAERDLASDAT